MVVDAHQHFWKFDPVRDSWIGDDMKAIQRDFLPYDLKTILDKNGIDGCVAVQASQSEEETSFLIDLAAENEFIKGVVGWIDLQADDVAERAAYFKQFTVVKGFRHVLQGEPQRDLMLQPAFKRGIEVLQPLSFTYDILIFPDQLKYVAELAAEFPEQGFVIDHLAKPYIKSGEINAWQKDMEAVAAYDNVYCKLSGMVTEADWKAWKQDDFKSYLDVVTAAFGVDRLLFGSDWPVCLVAGSYGQIKNIVADYFKDFAKEDKAKIFGGNAATFYHL